MIEDHAYETYESFLKTHESMLKDLSAPKIAIKYYKSSDMYLFDAMNSSRFDESTTTMNNAISRRPTDIHNLYDVFVNIRDDEREHGAMMRSMQDDNTYNTSPATIATASITTSDSHDVSSSDEKIALHNVSAIDHEGISFEKFDKNNSNDNDTSNDKNSSEVPLELELAFSERYCEGLLECVVNDLIPHRYNQKQSGTRDSN